MHVAGADLNDVHILHHEIRLARGGHFRHDSHPGFLSDLREDLQPFFPESLERIGRGARLEGPSPEQYRPAAAYLAGDFEGPLAVLDGAGAGDDHQSVPPDGDIAHSDDGRVGVKLATHELVGLADGNHLGDPGERLKMAEVPLDGPDHAEDRLLDPFDFLDQTILGAKLFLQMLQLVLRHAFLEQQDHLLVSFRQLGGKGEGHADSPKTKNPKETSSGSSFATPGDLLDPPGGMSASGSRSLLLPGGSVESSRKSS